MEHKSVEIKEICGIVMPISAIDGCNEGHWNDVMEIINDCIEEAGFEPNLVSNADDVGVIQKRIIQNLYENPVVVCDVSGKNPNVMFELGMRLAFDKPTIIIKDDKTTYSFDTSPIEHLEYPRDLRFNKIEDFKSKLIEKIKNTFKSAKDNENFSTFLKHFGEFKVAKIEKKEVTQQEYIIDELKSLRNLILNVRRNTIENSYDAEDIVSLDVCCGHGPAREIIEGITPQILALPEVISFQIQTRSNDHHHLKLSVSPSANKQFIRSEIRKLTKPFQKTRIIRKRPDIEKE